MRPMMILGGKRNFRSKRSSRKPVFAVLALLTIVSLAPATLQGVADYGIFKDEIPEGLLRDNDPCNARMRIDPSLVPAPEKFRSGLLYDLNENKIVWEKHMDSTVPIASITKVMVAYLVMEEVKAGRLSMDSLFTVPKAATLVGGSRVNLKAGSKVSVNNLLRAAMIRSGNDAAYTLAHNVDGSESAFVGRMNRKAAALGLDRTKYYNSTGMPNRVPGETDNMSSASDILVLSTALMRHANILDFTSRCQDTLCQGSLKLPYMNTNALVRSYTTEIDGLKTGFTNNAGYCIVATSKRCDHRVVAIVLGAPTKTDRNIVTADMLSNYYSSIGLGRLGENLADLATPVTIDVAEE